MKERQQEILVIGSFMMDLVVRTPRVPEEGETIIGLSFNRFPGGKGANQAVAAARLGGKVAMAGKLGEDGFGDAFLSVLEEESIDSAYVLRDVEAATGIGSITLDEAGNNRIIVVPGANMNYNLGELGEIEDVIAQSGIVMLQLEMNLDVVCEAVNLAHKHQVPVLLNPAPAQKLPDEMLAKVTYLTPNETEAKILSGIDVVDAKTAGKAAQALQAKGIKNVVVTLGDKGALVAGETGTEYVPGFPVQAVDTVAAGDAFNGALALAVVRGQSLAEAARFANAVGALAVTRPGAIPSLPTRSEVDQFMLGRK
ncbi:MAG: ribokinase [Firmicutes bacterium]|nr:ribokinase [Bacillota bacterium]